MIKFKFLKKMYIYQNILFSLIFLFILLHVHKLFFKKYNTTEGFNNNDLSIHFKKPYNERKNPTIFTNLYIDIYEELFQDKDRIIFEIDTIINNTNINNKSIILDIGSGIGNHLKILTEISPNTQGLELSQDMINYSKQKYPNIQCNQGNAIDTFLYNPLQFTHISMLFYTFYYIENKEQLIKNIFTWLQFNGYFILHLVDPYKFNPILSIINPSCYMPFQKCSSNNTISQPKHSKINYKHFKYNSTFNINDDKHATFEEKITHHKTGHVIKNIHTLYIESIEHILKICKQIGFTFIEKIDMKTCGYEFQYIYIFKKNNP